MSSSPAVWQLAFIGDCGIILLLFTNESLSPDSVCEIAAGSSLGEFEAPSVAWLLLLFLLGRGGSVLLLFVADGDDVSSMQLEGA